MRHVWMKCAVCALALSAPALSASAEVQAESIETGAVDNKIPVEAGSRIAVVSKNVNGDFWTRLQEGMEAAIEDLNEAYGLEKDDRFTMTFEGPKDELDVDTQINTLDAVIAENPAVLCLCAGDMDSCQAQLETAAENGIPVVVFDSNVVYTELVAAFRGTDNISLGMIAAEHMAEALQDEGTILIFSTQEKTAPVRERVAGFTEIIGGKPALEIAQVIYNDQVEDMEEAIRNAVLEHPEAAGVYCTNDEVTELFLDIYQDMEEQELVVIGTDATEKQREAIREGTELGCVSQDPFRMGYETIVTAAALTAEVNLPLIRQEVLLPPRWIDAFGLDLPENEEYLY